MAKSLTLRQEVEGAAAALCAGGAPSPRMVIRGESSPVRVCSIDWLSFSYFPRSQYWQDEIRHFLRANFGVANWELRGGWQGYEASAWVEGARVAWGGQSQRGSVHVEITGTVCAGCSDWSLVQEWLVFLQARLTRVDVAGDDFFGSAPVSGAVADYMAGAFVTGGRPPVARLVDDLGSGAGKTLYVGKRENGKLLRVYEKGRQLGDKLSEWVRWEVEFRAKDRVISADILTRPAEFLAGAFAPCAFWSQVRQVLSTVRERGQLSYVKLVSICRLHSGRAINALLQIHHGDIGFVLNLLRRGGIPARLSAAEISALTSQHGGVDANPSCYGSPSNGHGQAIGSCI